MVKYHFLSDLLNGLKHLHFLQSFFSCYYEMLFYQSVFAHEEPHLTRHESDESLHLLFLAFVKLYITFIPAFLANLTKGPDINRVLSVVVPLIVELHGGSWATPNNLLTFGVDASELAMKTKRKLLKLIKVRLEVMIEFWNCFHRDSLNFNLLARRKHHLDLRFENI